MQKDDLKSTSYQAKRRSDVGLLELDTDQVCFAPKDSDSTSWCVKWEDIKELKPNKSTSDKAMLKIICKDEEKSTVIFTLENRDILNQVREDMTKRILKKMEERMSTEKKKQEDEQEEGKEEDEEEEGGQDTTTTSAELDAAMTQLTSAMAGMDAVKVKVIAAKVKVIADTPLEKLVEVLNNRCPPLKTEEATTTSIINRGDVKDDEQQAVIVGKVLNVLPPKTEAINRGDIKAADEQQVINKNTSSPDSTTKPEEKEKTCSSTCLACCVSGVACIGSAAACIGSCLGCIGSCLEGCTPWDLCD